MKFSAAALVLAIGANAWKNVTYTTEVVTAVTTYCPEATQITYGGTTYTITEVRVSGDGRPCGRDRAMVMSRGSPCSEPRTTGCSDAPSPVRHGIQERRQRANKGNRPPP
jgi:hypothetical protein